MSGPDLVVIGGGLAGAVAAAAARARGATVTLVRKGWGATALSSGAWNWLEPDAAALALGRDATAQDLALERLFAECPGHPLAVLAGRDRARARVQAADAMAFVSSLLDGPAAPTGGPGFYASASGEVRWADRVSASMAAGELSQGTPGRVGVATFPGLEGWRPPAIVEALIDARDRGLAPGVSDAVEVPVEWPGAPPVLRAPDATRWLDAGSAPRVPRAPLRCLLLPPVLGFSRTADLLAAAAHDAGCPCAEATAGTPSVPGWRLQGALDAMLAARGVEVLAGTAVRQGSGLALRIGDRTLDPRAVVLATGKFIGGGLARAGRLRETVFDLPVTVAGRDAARAGVMSLTAERREDAQPLFVAGVSPRDGSRPAGLFVAGAIAADWGWPERGCGLVLAATMAKHAAEAALAHLGKPAEAAR